MNIGFIGLGVMGQPMARHLINAGHQLFSCKHLSEISPALLDAGLKLKKTPSDVARHVDVIITMLPDTPDVDTVLFGEQGVFDDIRAGTIIVDMSSISPTETKRFAELARRAGCHYLDAPVSGGQPGAEAGTLSIMVGGDEDVFQSVRPLFEILGNNINRVGDVGTGQICKIANQIVVALNIEAVAEALVFASKAGADPERIHKALMGGFASSRVLEVHGERMIKRQFTPGFRIDLHRKDLNLALNAAKQLGLSLPNTASAMQLFNSCAAFENGGDMDHSAMIMALETLAGHQIR